MPELKYAVFENYRFFSQVNVTSKESAANGAEI